MAWRIWQAKKYLAHTFNSNWSSFQNLKALNKNIHIDLTIVATLCDLTEKMTPSSLILLCNLGFCCLIFLSAKKCITPHLWPANCKWQTPSNLSHIFVRGNEKSNHKKYTKLVMNGKRNLVGESSVNVIPFITICV